MNELLREIEEDIRTERMQRWWNKFGKTMIHVSIAVLVGTAAGVAWQHYRHSVAMDDTSQLLKGTDLMAAQDYKGAIAAFDAFKGKHSVHADMAMLQKGQAEEALGDAAGAAKTYQELAKRGDKTAFAAIGQLLAAKRTDAPLEVSKNSALFHLQSETRAWQLIQAGKKEEAVKIFAALRDDKEAPRTLRARAYLALSTLAPEAASTKEPGDE